MSPSPRHHSRQETSPTARRPASRQRPLVLASLVAVSPASVNWESVRRPVGSR